MSELKTLSAAFDKATNIEEAERELQKYRSLRGKDKELIMLRKLMGRTLDLERRLEWKALCAKHTSAILAMS
ncbi:hypothetical protein AJ79_04419 [Helicocarpus griseus UAMH5409]|uniref:Uncharacterized protein n=1 Tax=Helicocarpus griseus UAMH5409 TaxID=1447875 RepID=A0A2B7XTE9_9EURO|nr:hypothetical protein AJ79_04419 [Helicocarpus griseus UAMH5409]